MKTRAAAMKRGFLWLLKNTLNRLTLRLARRRLGPFWIIRHVGRKSGRSFETPLILAPVPEGFVAELTYGLAAFGRPAAFALRLLRKREFRLLRASAALKWH
jgi:hypothetical protein